MRNRVRIQHYVSRDLQRRLRTWAAAQDVTESAVTEAALSVFLDDERPDEKLIVRRLDGVTRAMAQLQDELDVLSGAFGRFVRQLFLLVVTPAGPDQERRAEARYQSFLRGIFDQSRAGTRFSSEVRRAHAAVAASGSETAPTGGR
jgi:hypothetical protein